ncbi:unnamed protein product, partial [Cyprideis torosa]
MMGEPTPTGTMRSTIWVPFTITIPPFYTYNLTLEFIMPSSSDRVAVDVLRIRISYRGRNLLCFAEGDLNDTVIYDQDIHPLQNDRLTLPLGYVYNPGFTQTRGDHMESDDQVKVEVQLLYTDHPM